MKCVTNNLKEKNQKPQWLWNERNRYFTRIFLSFINSHFAYSQSETFQNNTNTYRVSHFYGDSSQLMRNSRIKMHSFIFSTIYFSNFHFHFSVFVFVSTNSHLLKRSIIFIAKHIFSSMSCSTKVITAAGLSFHSFIQPFWTHFSFENSFSTCIAHWIPWDI